MDELRFLSPEQAVKTCDYLQSLSERYPTTAVKVQSLFARCCLATNPDFAFDLQEMSREASCIADAILGDPLSEDLGLDPLLIVETHLLLREAGCDLPALATLTKKISAELLAQSDDIRSGGRVRLVASELLSLGCAVSVTKPRSTAAALIRSADKWLSLPTPDLVDVVEHLFADRTPLNEISSQILSLIALGELRNYKVDVGCKLLRLVVLQGTPCDEISEALNYVAAQRRRDGGYGFMSPFMDESRDPSKVDLSFHLPMTLNVAWLFRTEATHRSEHNALVARY